MSTVVTRCDPPFPVMTPKGSGLAHWRIERGIEMFTTYEVWVNSGEIWEFAQNEIRSEENVTAMRLLKGKSL